MNLLVRFFGVGIINVFLLVNASLAHHSHGNYAIGTEIQVKGVVANLLLRNPHVWVFVDVENAEGETENWGIETGGLAGFKKKGWGDISVGDSVSVKCTPTRDGSNGCLLIDMTVGASTGASSESKEWFQYIDREQFFMVNFLTEPTVTTEPYKSEFGATFPSKVYTSRTDDSLYSITVVDYTDAKNVYLKLAETTYASGIQYFWIYDQMASIAYAAQQFRSRGGEVTYDAWHHVDFNDGHEIYTANLDGTRTYAGIYRHAGRLYILEATIPGNAPPPGVFQQSLVVIDAQGKRVRYQLDPINQSRVRIETDY